MARKRKGKGSYTGFKALSKKVGKSGKVRNPDAVAAAIGRKKYGKAGMAKLAAQGRKKGASHSTSARKARASRVRKSR